MTVSIHDGPRSTLVVPPVYSPVIMSEPGEAFAQACRLAATDGAGTLVFSKRADIIEVAVVFEPEEALASARRAFFAGMLALADAIGAHAPPEMPMAVAWPDTLLFDGARLGGGRLGWPEACPEDAVPDWLVFSGMVIVSKRHAGDPGLTPGSTSLEEEGFALDGHEAVIESFARNLMKAFETWAEDGFDTLASRYLAHLPSDPSGDRRRLDEHGDCLIGDPSSLEVSRRLELLPALRAVAWLDPEIGTPRL